MAHQDATFHSVPKIAEDIALPVIRVVLMALEVKVVASAHVLQLPVMAGPSPIHFQMGRILVKR
jgi:hypothetical protein